MNNVASTPRALTLVACAMAACVALVALVAAPAEAAHRQSETGQSPSSAAEREVAARIRGELEARLAQITAQLHELQSARGVDDRRLQSELEALSRRLEASAVSSERLQEMTEMRLAEALAQSNLHAAESKLRVEEATRQAMEAAQRAVLAGQYRAFGAAASCDLLGERIVDHADELGLSDDQIDRIGDAQRAMRRAGIARKADIEVARMDLEILYEADELDLAAIREKLQEVAMLEVESQMAGLALRQQVRGELTPEQVESWDDIRGDTGRIVFATASGSRNAVTWSNFDRIGC